MAFVTKFIEGPLYSTGCGASIAVVFPCAMAGLTLPGGIGRALKHRDLRFYLVANLQSNICTWAARLATAWLSWHLT